MSEQTQSASPVRDLHTLLGLIGRSLRARSSLARVVAVIILFVLLAAVLSYAGDISSWPQRITLVLATLVELTLAEFLGIAVHEAGHLLAARLVGFRFVACRIGPLTVKRTRHGLRIGPSTGTIFGGYALCVPMDGRRLRSRYVVFISGGPLATIVWIAGLIGLTLFLLLLAISASGTEAASPLPSLISLLNVVIWISALLMSIIPLRLHGKPNDGQLLLDCLRGGAYFERKLALAGMWASMQQGLRPRTWAESLVHTALEPVDTSIERAQALLFAYSWALDSGHIERAGAYLDQVIASAPETPRWTPVPPVVALECAYFFARHRGDPAAARQWLEQGTGSTFESFMRPRAFAAILLAEDKLELALDVARQGLAELAQSGAELERLGTDAQCELENLYEMAATARTALAVARSSEGNQRA